MIAASPLPFQYHMEIISAQNRKTSMVVVPMDRTLQHPVGKTWIRKTSMVVGVTSAPIQRTNLVVASRIRSVQTQKTTVIVVSQGCLAHSLQHHMGIASMVVVSLVFTFQ